MKMQRRAANCDDSIDPEAREWPHLAVDVQDPKACLAQCQQRFVSEVVPAPDDDTTAMCEVLNRTAEAQEHMGFGWLYCCSSVLCGVSFDRETKSPGQDPNVNGIVNECRNLDYENVVDPGVPSDDFNCPESSVYAPGEARACVNFVGATDLKSSSSSFSLSSSPSLAAPSSPTTPSESSVSRSDPTPDADLIPSHDSSSVPSEDGLAAGVKAAIGVLSFLAFLALLSILLCLLRRRYPSLKKRQAVRNYIKHTHSPPSTSSSPSRLVPISTSSRTNTSAALSPPLRLKDRRLLLTLMDGPPRHPQPRAAFPTSPICAPTTSKLVPRNENAPLPPFSPTPKPRSSTSSRSSISRASLRASTDPPARPPRPHDAPLEIPNLVVPAGPPPERALPPTPPSAGPKTDIGVAISRNSGLLERSRDSVEEYGRARANWGSWGTRVVSPVLREDELERMGGKYT